MDSRPFPRGACVALAVVGIVSTCNGNTVDDPARMECRLGRTKVLVPLSGVIARAVPAAAP
jgi:hypothetical protein